MKQQTLFIKFKRNPNLMNLKSSTHLFKIKYHLQSSYDSQKCLSTINYFISINWKQQIVLIKFKGELNHINLKSSTHLFKINYHLQTSYDSQNCLSTTKKNYNKGSFNNYVDKNRFLDPLLGYPLIFFHVVIELPQKLSRLAFKGVKSLRLPKRPK